MTKKEVIKDIIFKAIEFIPTEVSKIDMLSLKMLLLTIPKKDYNQFYDYINTKMELKQ